MVTDNRELGPEMIAEGWSVVGGDWIHWMEPWSKQVVSLDGPIQRQHAHVPCWDNPTPPPETEGYVVAQRTHADNGNPVEGSAIWLTSYALALKIARRLRTRILANVTSVPGTQVMLDDALKGES